MDIIYFLFSPVKIRLLPLATDAVRFYHFFFFLLFFRVISGTYGDTMGRNVISQVTSLFFTPRSIINFRDRDSHNYDSKTFFFGTYWMSSLNWNFSFCSLNWNFYFFFSFLFFLQSNL